MENRKNVTLSDNEQFVVSVEEEENAFVRAGIPYKEVDGILYPVLNEVPDSDIAAAGKYGRLWMKMFYEMNRRAYHQKLLLGTLVDEAIEKNEEAYKFIDANMKKAVEGQPVTTRHSTMQMLNLRNQILAEVEEKVVEMFRDELSECY